MNRFQPYIDILSDAVEKTDAWRESFGVLPDQLDKKEKIRGIITRLAESLEGNYPFHHPQYAGQMLKPPHPVAWLAYSLAMAINPNNHALDGGPPTSEMEKNVVASLAEMAGYGSSYLGHLTSGGTIANLEALFVAREIHPGKAIAASANAHYTHQRMCRVLNAPFLTIPVDDSGKPDLHFIRDHAENIGTLVVTLGTTGLGIVEPLADILELAEKFSFRVHADAAYGGFFKLISRQLPSQKHWECLHLCDSIVIDPHKHGLQPYGCGSVLYKDPECGKFFKHDSPYTYFTSDDLHLGEISLECSRAGAAAAALWATLRLLPLAADTGLGGILAKTRNAACLFSEAVKQQKNWQLYTEPNLDIAAYFNIPKKKTLSELNRLNKNIFDAGMRNKENGFHVSLFKIPAELFISRFPDYQADTGTAIILRSVFMKDEHEEFVPEFARRLFRAEHSD